MKKTATCESCKKYDKTADICTLEPFEGQYTTGCPKIDRTVGVKISMAIMFLVITGVLWILHPILGTMALILTVLMLASMSEIVATIAKVAAVVAVAILIGVFIFAGDAPESDIQSTVKSTPISIIDEIAAPVNNFEVSQAYDALNYAEKLHELNGWRTGVVLLVDNREHCTHTWAIVNGDTLITVPLGHADDGTLNYYTLTKKEHEQEYKGHRIEYVSVTEGDVWYERLQEIYQSIDEIPAVNFTMEGMEYDDAIKLHDGISAQLLPGESSGLLSISYGIKSKSNSVHIVNRYFVFANTSKGSMVWMNSTQYNTEVMELSEFLRYMESEGKFVAWIREP